MIQKNLPRENEGICCGTFLSERDQRWKDDEEIDGVAISKIETLMLDFNQFEKFDLELIEQHVEECLDTGQGHRWTTEVEI